MTDKTEAAKDVAGAKRAPANFRTILGEKVGMTQVYGRRENRLFGVTVVKAGPCPVVRVKTDQGPDGYNAVQLAYGARPEKNISKPVLGQFRKAGVAPARWFREIRVADVKGLEAGQIVTIDGAFKPGDYVDVQGTSKGHGFAGVMKRHGFRGLPASHGASDKQRSPGSLASRRSLGRVLPGQRMAGHMGNETVSSLKLEVIKIDPEANLIYLAGPVPGPRGGLVTISETVNARKRYVEPQRLTVKKDKMGNIIGGKKPTKAAPK
ncbi:MAG TPA: 50S ribosomal protein L3 [Elusimicrobia bacterium]|nr:50S ribosomal protein L3 [Elusimicrobiota bacterium]HBT62411.1 50S ribosomal protein L3 [Elusimicrobiota bacterium]